MAAAQVGETPAPRPARPDVPHLQVTGAAGGNRYAPDSFHPPNGSEGSLKPVWMFTCAIPASMPSM